MHFNMTVLNLIVTMFITMTKSNTLIISVSMTSKNQAIIIDTIIMSWRLYQNLQKVAIVIYFITLYLQSQSQSLSLAVNYWVSYLFLHLASSAVTTMNFSFITLQNEFNKLKVTIIIKTTIIKKIKKHKSKKSLLNVYIALHYTDIATEYVTMINCNILAEKIMHK